MATRILEFHNIQRREDHLPVVPVLGLKQAAMTASATSAQSSAFSFQYLGSVCIQSDEAIYVEFGDNPTATTDSYRIAAGGEQFFEAKKGQKVAIRT